MSQKVQTLRPDYFLSMHLLIHEQPAGAVEFQSFINEKIQIQIP